MVQIRFSHVPHNHGRNQYRILVDGKIAAYIYGESATDAVTANKTHIVYNGIVVASIPTLDCEYEPDKEGALNK